jgi:hypothetical protein
MFSTADSNGIKQRRQQYSDSKWGTPYALRRVVPSRLLLRTLSLMLLLLLLPHRCHSFANYLASRSNCLTELSTDEVIMNSAVGAYEDSDDPSMRITAVLVVARESGGSGNNAFTVADNHPGSNGSNQVYLLEKLPAEIQLKVSTTNLNTDKDYQWAMDVVVGAAPDPSGGGDGAADVAGHPPPVVASFVDGACENSVRITGKGKDATVTLSIRQPPSSTSEGLLPGAAAAVTVVAGWATGHERVRLTPTLSFLVGQGDASRSGGSVQEGGENPETGPGDQLPEQGDREEMDPQKIVDKGRFQEHTKKLQRGKKEKLDRYKRRDQKDDEGQRLQLKDRDRHEEENPSSSQQHPRNSNLLRYNIGFDMVTGMSLGSYFRGSLFFLVAIAVSIQACMHCSTIGSRQSGLARKGRRNL